MITSEPEIYIRPSAMPRIVKCPAAAYRLSDIKVDTSSQIANHGSCCHEVMADAVKLGYRPDVAPYAKRWKVDEKAVGIHTWLAWEIWDTTMGGDLPGLKSFCVDEPSVEFAPEHSFKDISGGRVDVLSLDEDKAVIVDWKFGAKTDTDYSAQLMTYGALVAEQFKPLTIHLYIVWGQTGEWEDITDGDLPFNGLRLFTGLHEQIMAI